MYLPQKTEAKPDKRSVNGAVFIDIDVAAAAVAIERTPLPPP